MMRITFLLPNAGLAGGVRVVVCLAQQLRRRGHEAVIVSLPLRQPGVKERLAGLLRGRIVRKKDLVGSQQSYFTAADVPHHVIDRFRPIVASDVPDADWIVATWYETAPWAMDMPPAKGGKAFFVQQYDANIAPWKTAEVDAAWRLPMRKIVCSQWLSDLGQTRFNTGPLPVVPNGIDPLLFHAPPRRRGSPPTLGFLYAPIMAKGMPVARAVISRVREAIPNLRIMSFGSAKPSRRSPIPDGCEFHYRPRQTELRDLYARCDVWLCCSHSEGFHLPPHEAMACRCPVASTRVGGPMDMIEDGFDGFLASPGDVEALASAVEKVLTCTDDAWAAFSERALAKALRYSWERSAESFEHALTSGPGGAG